MLSLRCNPEHGNAFKRTNQLSNGLTLEMQQISRENFVCTKLSEDLINEISSSLASLLSAKTFYPLNLFNEFAFIMARNRRNIFIYKIKISFWNNV